MGIEYSPLNLYRNIISYTLLLLHSHWLTWVIILGKPETGTTVLNCVFHISTNPPRVTSNQKSAANPERLTRTIWRQIGSSRCHLIPSVNCSIESVCEAEGSGRKPIETEEEANRSFFPRISPRILIYLFASSAAAVAPFSFYIDSRRAIYERSGGCPTAQGASFLLSDPITRTGWK